MALLRRDYVGAGDLYYRDGKIAKAAEMYAKAGSFGEAEAANADQGRH